MEIQKTRYITDSYYFSKKTSLIGDFRKLISVSAKSVGNNCNYYHAELLSPIRGAKETKKSGSLPKNKKEKSQFIENIVNWIFDNSKSDELFVLFLDDSPIDRKKCSKFCHHDDTCCWDLNLTEKEFKSLRNDLKSNNLPTDIFYDSSKAVYIKKENGVFGKFLEKIGFVWENKVYYSPKQAEAMKNQGVN